MAGSFSGHLVDSFISAQQASRGPFGQANIATHGPMSFAPQMHGTCASQQHSFFSDQTFMELSEDTAKKIATLQAKLNKKLGPEYISQRPGPGGGPKLTYAEGWKIINLANEVFGFNGWSSSVLNLTTDFIDCNEETRRFTVGVTAVVRITLRDGVFHEDVGYGMLENSKSKGAALDKCKKEAVTDAVKRTLRNFGNLLGNCLYDKAYTQEVVKIKVPPPKFDRSMLHRRPEFDDSRTETSMDTPSKPCISTATSSRPVNPNPQPVIKSEPLPDVGSNAPPKQRPALSAVPPHMRTVSAPSHGPTAASTPIAKGKPPLVAEAVPTGLHTPIQTPAGPSGNPRQSKEQRLQQMQEALQMQQQENQRRVTFAPVVPVSTSTLPANEINDADDDAFHFNSDDDAFLANVDLGDGDEGLGGPIDFEEGSGGVSSSSDVGLANDTGGDSFGHPPIAPSSRPAPVSTIPQNQQSRSAHAQSIHPPPPRPAQVQANVTQFRSAQAQTMPPPPPRQVAPPAQQPRTTQQQQPHQSTSRQHTPHANQNVPPIRQTNHDTSSSTATAASGRAPTPSMGGGFYFPPGVDLQGLRPNASLSPGPQASSRGQAQPTGSGSGIGLKRSADIMQAQSTASVRRPAQGMGLAQQTANGGAQQARREPFATLELGEGGDVKRTRR
ncbi:DNA repair and recombination protein rhm52 [Grifola frondosa]|uniref:DNA repair and recombination protein rhm52 n=1 Tax=Grifola frondosa TaxID=5627 RepID=A0A1C7LV21_GRIFR|nr:DNA repair and recombination protein rhm52 [Grifola frondosa]